MVQIFLARGGVVGIIHTDIPRGFATRAAFLEVLTIATFEDIYFREVDSWIVVVVNCTIPRTQMFCAERKA